MRSHFYLLGVLLLGVLFAPSAAAQDNPFAANPEYKQTVHDPNFKFDFFNFSIDYTKIYYTPTGLGLFIRREGAGPQPSAGQMLKVHYQGLLTNGKQFDNSFTRNEALGFVLGAGQVIPGWEEAFSRLHVGTQALIIIPPHLAYGRQGAGNGTIPPNATLLFYVELLSAEAPTGAGSTAKGR